EGGELTIVGANGNIVGIENWTVSGAGLAPGSGFVLSGGVYSLVAVPEPSTYALLGATGALALALLRRRSLRRTG
ncbi:MAG: PEP-CTERM sorting domain-containing protein, partial [Puniceicoccales bacterium]|nr:PEP-CTERM sorting domain-containing protein [Puniceicoccales bacterium]